MATEEAADSDQALPNLEQIIWSPPSEHEPWFDEGRDEFTKRVVTQTYPINLAD